MSNGTQSGQGVSGLLLPFVECVGAGGTALRDLLRDRANVQLELLQTSQQLHQMCPMLRSIDLETGGRISEVVRRMWRILSTKFRDWEKLDEAIYLSKRRAHATSPRLLVARAVCYSHAQWWRDHYRDLLSAESARQDLAESLGQLSKREQVVLQQAIATAVRYQSVIRSALLKDETRRETFLLCSSQQNQSRLLGAIATGLRNDWSHPCVLWTAFTHSLCCEGRLESEARDGDLDEMIETALTFITREKRGSVPDPIVHFEYGKYRLNRQPEKEIEAIRKKTNRAGCGWQVIWASYQRVPYASLDLTESKWICEASKSWQPEHFKLLRYGTVTAPRACGDIWKCIEHEISKLRDGSASDATGRPGAFYCPMSKVRSILHDLRRVYPDEFYSMRIERPANSDWPAGVDTIDLPIRKPPKTGRLKLDVQAKRYDSPKLIVARTAAAAIVNQQMMFGTPHLNIIHDCARKKTEDRWRKAIDWVDGMNHHETLRAYAGQYNSASMTTSSRLRDQQPPEGLILCLDIGATNIKAEFFDEEQPNRPILGPFRFPTRAKHRFADGRAFATYVRSELKKKLAGQHTQTKNKLPPLAAVSIGWPGAVSGTLGYEEVAATSGILSCFQHLTGTVNTSDDIRGLRLREAFRKVFKVQVVRIANDGTCHVMSSDFAGLQRNQTYLILVAGTGTALGVINGGDTEPAQILGEVGKMVIDVGCDFPNQGNFPSGVANRHFSHRTIPLLAQLARKQFGVVIPEPFDLDSLRVGLFIANRGNVIQPCEEGFREELRETMGPSLGNRPESASSHFHRDVPADEMEILRLKTKAGKLADNHQSDLAAVCNYLVREAGSRLADLVALTAEMVGAERVIACGGPMTGQLGARIREEAKEFLFQRYRYDTAPAGRHRIRAMALEGPRGDQQDETGTLGALRLGMNALNRYRTEQAQWRLRDLVNKTDNHAEIAVYVKKGDLKVKRNKRTLTIPYLGLDEAVRYLESHAADLGLSDHRFDNGRHRWRKTLPLLW